MNRLPYSDDDDHDDNNSQAALAPRGINPRPSSALHNHRYVVDSSEREDYQGRPQLHKHNNKHLLRQPRTTNPEISWQLRMLEISTNLPRQRAARSQQTINRNRRSFPDYSDMISTNDEGLSHFSHPHPLNKYNFYSETNCEVCGLKLVGSAYGCQSCQFYLHKSCFDLPQKIQHHTHTAHPLTLRYPSYYKHCGKTCDACTEDIQQSFLYCCDLCCFDLHVTCATLNSCLDRAGDTLQLQYTFPVVAQCNVCNKKVSKEGWLYYSKDTGHIAHINCATKVNPSWIKDRLNKLRIN